MQETVDGLLRRIIISNKLCSPKQVKEAKEVQEKAQKRGKPVSLDGALRKLGYLSEAQQKGILRGLTYYIVRKDDKRLAKLAVTSGIVDALQADTCLSFQKTEYQEKHRLIRLRKILLQKGFASAKESAALQEAVEREKKGEKIEKVDVAESEATLDQFGDPVVNLEEEKEPEELVLNFPDEAAEPAPEDDELKLDLLPPDDEKKPLALPPAKKERVEAPPRAVSSASHREKKPVAAAPAHPGKSGRPKSSEVEGSPELRYTPTEEDGLLLDVPDEPEESRPVKIESDAEAAEDLALVPDDPVAALEAAASTSSKAKKSGSSRTKEGVIDMTAELGGEPDTDEEPPKPSRRAKELADYTEGQDAEDMTKSEEQRKKIAAKLKEAASKKSGSKKVDLSTLPKKAGEKKAPDFSKFKKKKDE